MNTQPIILVVEDEPLSRDMLERRLARRGFEVAAVSDGMSCLQWLEARPCDLVLLDLSMPGMDGFEIIQKLRSKWSHDSLPIIVVSARVDSEDVVRALTFGANDYVVKPVNFRVLMARIRSSLRMKHNVSLLVEAERQRVMIESLGKSAAQIAKPLGQMIDRLEAVSADIPEEPGELKLALGELLELAEEAVQVIEKMKEVGDMRNVPHTERLDLLDSSETPVEED